MRRAQEGRDPLPPKATELENKWGDMEGAADDLRNALLLRLEYHNREADKKETDAMCAAGDQKGADWLAAVKKQADDYSGRVRASTFGGSAAETQKLLDDFRDDFRGKKRPKWAEEKGGLEADRRVADARRRGEGREAYPWNPSNGELSGGWGELNKAADDYEQGLLEKLGALKAEEAEALRRRKLRDDGLNNLAELLPPLVARAAAVDRAAARAAEVFASAPVGAPAGAGPATLAAMPPLPEGSAPAGGDDSAAELLEWLNGETDKLGAKLAQSGEGGAKEGTKPPPSADLAVVQGEIESLKTLTEEVKPAKLTALMKMKEALADADAMRQLYRYAGTPSTLLKNDLSVERTNLGQIESKWDELEAKETMLRSQLTKQAARLRGTALEFERLRRGCVRVADWLSTAQPTLESAELGSSEGEVCAAALLCRAAVPRRCAVPLCRAACDRVGMAAWGWPVLTLAISHPDCHLIACHLSCGRCSS